MLPHGCYQKHAVGPFGNENYPVCVKGKPGNYQIIMSEIENTPVEETDVTTLGRFELPRNLEKIEDPNDPNHMTFVADPFENGYGHTLGNSLRRVLLGSLEGAAITTVRIAGAQHEFSSLPGVVEDVTEIVLNLKKVKFKHNGKEPRLLSLRVHKQGVVTAADIAGDDMYEVVNPEQIICTLDQDTMFECEFQVRVGRGFCTGEENKVQDMPIGVIPIDSIFSPVTRVKYAVQNTRVGQMTDYDKLTLEIWTDGRISPTDALLQSSAILRHHLDVFVNYTDDLVKFESAPSAIQDEETARLRKLLNMSVNEIELSVRAANCLNNANITTVGQLAMKSESEMLKYRNFGKKSLNEIKDKLLELGLSLGVQVDPALLSGPVPQAKPMRGIDDGESPVGLHDLIAQNIEDDD